MELMRTKSVEQSIADTDEPEHRLRRALGPVQLTVFGVGVIIIGTGIFVLTGVAAGTLAGPSVAIASRPRESSARSPRSATRSSPRPSPSPARRT